MTDILPSPLEYFSDEEVPFSDTPNTFAYITFDFTAMTFALNVKEDGEDEYLGGDCDLWGKASRKSVKSFIKEVCDQYGVDKFPKSLKKKALTFIQQREYAESFATLVRKQSLFNRKTTPDVLKVHYFKPLPGVFSGYLSVQRGANAFAGVFEDKETLKGSIKVLNDALQDATEIDAVANTFCLLADIGRQLPGGEVNYSYTGGSLLIPYDQPRPRLVEELLVPGDGEIRRLNLPRVQDRRFIQNA